MPESAKDDELVLVDSMKLAYGVFQSCRHLQPDAGVLLDALHSTLDRVRKSETLCIKVSRRWVDSLPSYIEACIPSHTDDAGESLSRLSKRGKQLLRFIELATVDLRPLWSLGNQVAVLSLGYALHPIPRLVRAGEEFDPEDYRFCFRIAAFCWSDLSQELQQMLCDLVELDRGLAEEYIKRPGFTIDMYGHSRE